MHINQQVGWDLLQPALRTLAEKAGKHPQHALLMAYDMYDLLALHQLPRAGTRTCSVTLRTALAESISTKRRASRGTMPAGCTIAMSLNPSALPILK